MENKTITTPMKAEQLEEQRIRNACKRDRDFQDGKAKEFAIAPQIIEQYCNGEIDYETAIAQIMAKCHRGRTCAILNIENSAPIYAHL